MIGVYRNVVKITYRSVWVLYLKGRGTGPKSMYPRMPVAEMEVARRLFPRAVGPLLVGGPL